VEEDIVIEAPARRTESALAAACGRRRRAPVAALLLVVVLVPSGCARRIPRADAGDRAWQLMDPPEAPDARYPRGSRIRSHAPLAEWRAVGDFATLEECERAMHARIDDTIDRARAAVGADAKNDLTVRHAVNARCVQRMPDPGAARAPRD
jgi:hypothetical protein